MKRIRLHGILILAMLGIVCHAACVLYAQSPDKLRRSSENSLPKIWFQHDDFVKMRIDTVIEKKFVPDMLSRWYDHENWRHALDNTAVYSIHEKLFQTDGTRNGMGAKFVRLLSSTFGNMDTTSLYIAYLKLILPVLHAHNVELQIHTIGSKRNFVPWIMHGKTKSGVDTTFLPDSSGLKRIKNTLKLVNGVCDSLFSDGYRVTQVKLQSVLSGIWQRGIRNNVYCALEYMKGVQEVYPDMTFYLGDALLQRRNFESLDWRFAYDSLRYTMLTDTNYTDLHFKGLRVEFNKHWNDTTLFENAPGWSQLEGAMGAVEFVHGFNWKIGLEFNNPFAKSEWEYENLVLRTAEKSQELGLHWDFVVLHTDEAGGADSAFAYPFDVSPEDRGPNDPPTFSSVLNKVFDFYYNPVAINSPGDLPTHFSLGQNYPNPFNPTTTIQFTIPVKSFVSLEVFDILGRQVSVLLSKQLSSGRYSLQWNASGLPSGMYFYRLTAGTFSEAKKLILLQ